MLRYAQHEGDAIILVPLIAEPREMVRHTLHNRLQFNPGFLLIYSWASRPPSTVRVLPLIKLASSEARKQMAAANSSGVPI